MLYHLGLEDMEPGHWIAYVFELPGCFSSAMDAETAIANAPDRIATRLNWLEEKGLGTPHRNGFIQVEVAETFNSWPSSDDYVVNAFFERDRPPLTKAEVEQAIPLLNHSRKELMAVAAKIPANKLHEPNEGAARGSIAGTLEHIAWAEWWYFSQLDMAFARSEMPADPFGKLDKSRQNTLAQLPKLAGDARVVEHSGEQWSARKILRRTLWHEADHTAHIQKLI